MASPQGDDARCTRAAEVRLIRDAAGTAGIQAEFHVPAPADLLLELLWNVDNFPELFPDIKSYDVLRSSDASVDVAFRVNAVVKELRYVLRRELSTDTAEIRWSSLSGDLRKISGGWSLRPTATANVTLAVYRTFVDPGRMIPSRLVAAAAKRQAQILAQRVREVAVRRCDPGC